MQLFPSVESFEIHPSVFLMEVDESEMVWSEKVDDFVFIFLFIEHFVLFLPSWWPISLVSSVMRVTVAC